MVAFRLLKGKEIGVSDELTDKFLDEKAAKKLTMGPSFLDPALGEGLLSRHKFFTARLQEAVATRGGSPQVVSLGVGFDTRALTEECLEGLDVFEVDFPAVLEDKYSTLARGGVPRPPSVRAVGADLNSAVPALAEAGYALPFTLPRLGTPSQSPWRGCVRPPSHLAEAGYAGRFIPAAYMRHPPCFLWQGQPRRKPTRGPDRGPPVLPEAGNAEEGPLTLVPRTSKGDARAV
mmetsp:Transcript_16985/g.53944  ORF Transcript_16985/g.53944 Transcript_16985/m.53944 type:complete len:233 (+) Transcript_16985:476-1174(+)